MLEIVSRDDAGQARRGGQDRRGNRIDPRRRGPDLREVCSRMSAWPWRPTPARRRSPLPRGRAAGRCPGLGQGQPLHLPPAALDLHAGRHAGQAAPRRTGAKRWATIAPNYAYGKDAVAAFQKILKELNRPEVEFVAEQWPALFKIDAAAEVQAISGSRRRRRSTTSPSAVRPGQVRARREARPAACSRIKQVFGLLTGEPEYLDPLKDEAPGGLGCDRLSLVRHPGRPAHDAFVDGLSGEVRRLPARRIAGRLQHHARRSPRRIDKRRLAPRPRPWSMRIEGAGGRHADRARSPIARSTISRPWAPMSGGRRCATARA